MKGVFARLLSYARNPLSFQPGRSHRGRCNICGHSGRFLLRWSARGNLRENLACARCRSISRDRFLAWTMSAALGRPEVLADWPVEREVRILEPSPRRGRAEILASKVDYRPIEFPRETLEGLPSPSESFDHVVTADVFEHVRHDERAFREVFRVLRPGGLFFLQVPFRPDWPTETRVRPEGDRDVYLAPPEIHGERTLAYRTYGTDLLSRLERIGFSVRLLRGGRPEWGIPEQFLILGRKGAPIEDLPGPRDLFSSVASPRP